MITGGIINEITDSVLDRVKGIRSVGRREEKIIQRKLKGPLLKSFVVSILSYTSSRCENGSIHFCTQWKEGQDSNPLFLLLFFQKSSDVDDKKDSYIVKGSKGCIRIVSIVNDKTSNRIGGLGWTALSFGSELEFKNHVCIKMIQ